MDIDLAGRTSNELDHVAEVIRSVCDVISEPDGIEFDSASVEARRIEEGAEYEGVRIRFNATLARARIPMQIDIGFGDVIVPAPARLQYPALLEFPAPVLFAYPKETVVAEKLEALTKLGLLNSRLKDYYDMALLSRLYSFTGAVLIEAVQATFQNRETKIDSNPVGLTEAYFTDPSRQLQWTAFIRRNRFAGQGVDLKEVVSDVRRFAIPLLEAASKSMPLSDWTAGGPWN
jgi:hypothetical protein